MVSFVESDGGCENFRFSVRSDCFGWKLGVLLQKHHNTSHHIQNTNIVVFITSWKRRSVHFESIHPIEEDIGLLDRGSRCGFDVVEL
jgi:hypothetical protein